MWAVSLCVLYSNLACVQKWLSTVTCIITAAVALNHFLFVIILSVSYIYSLEHSPSFQHHTEPHTTHYFCWTTLLIQWPHFLLSFCSKSSFHLSFIVAYH